MSKQVKLEAATVDISVVELVACLNPRQHFGQQGLPPGLAARIGHRAHRHYRSLRNQAGLDYDFEVPVEFELYVDGFTATVHGRIDGRRHAGDNLWVEEVKSTQSPAGDAAARQQLRFYAYGLMQHHPGSAVHGHLVRLGPPYTEFQLEVVDIDEAAIRLELESAIRGLIDQARSGQARAEARRARASDIRFAHPTPRGHQAQLIEEMSASLRSGRPLLATAPTGTGKTACALYAALEYAQSHAASVYFASAKTSQQLLAKTTADRMRDSMGKAGEDLRSLTLQARSKYCGDSVEACPHSHCPHRTQTIASPDDYDIAVQRLFTQSPHAGPDEINALARELSLCAYELSMQSREYADLCIGDYNYIYHRPAAINPGQAQVVIVDEVHNLGPRVRDQHSHFLARSCLSQALVSPLIGPDMAEFLREVANEIDRELQERGETEFALVQGSAPVELNRERWQSFHDRAQWLRLELAEQLQGQWPYEDPLIEALYQLEGLTRALAEDDAGQVAYLANDDGPHGAGVGSICIDAAEQLEAIHRQQLGTLAMSATLHPIEDYARSLGLSDLSPRLTVIPPSFPREHRKVVIDPSFDTRLEARLGEAPRIAARVQELIGLRHGNYLLCCSSFNFAASLRAQLNHPDYEVVMQIPGADAAWQSRMMTKLMQRQGGQRALLLIAVTGGSLSEGIDLPGEALIGVIVVGPPLRPIDFRGALTQLHHEEAGEDGFSKAFIEPAMRKVVQSAGRLIRSQDDRGIIALLGQRFASPPYLSCLPPDWYAYEPSELISDDPVREARDFWAELEEPS